jgi:hypothetical protein
MQEAAGAAPSADPVDEEAVRARHARGNESRGAWLASGKVGVTEAVFLAARAGPQEAEEDADGEQDRKKDEKKKGKDAAPAGSDEEPEEAAQDPQEYIQEHYTIGDHIYEGHYNEHMKAFLFDTLERPAVDVGEENVRSSEVTNLAAMVEVDPVDAKGVEQWGLYTESCGASSTKNDAVVEEMKAWYDAQEFGAFGEALESQRNELMSSGTLSCF